MKTETQTGGASRASWTYTVWIGSHAVHWYLSTLNDCWLLL